MKIRSFLIEVALSKKGKISLSELPQQEIEERVRRVWREGLPEGSSPEVVEAVDGSRNKKTYAGYVIYAVGACSLRFEGGSLGQEAFTVEIDLLKPEEYSDARLRTLMGIVEAKRALDGAGEAGALLIDGSIVGDVLRPTVFNYEIGERERKWALELFKELKEGFTTNGVDSKEFYGEIEKKFPGREFPVVAGFLEYLEYLYSLYRLIEEGKEKIIAVSKRSNSNFYGLDPVLPDITAFYLANPPDGYSEPHRVKVAEKKFNLPGEFEELLMEKEFWSFYFRCGGGIYKCETNMEPLEALKVLVYYQVRGYPFPLREVHRRVKITRSDMEEVIRILKHRGITGREGLGE